MSVSNPILTAMHKPLNSRTHSIYILIAALLFVAAALFGIVSGFSPAEAAFNPQINYQGKLTNLFNVPVADGTYNIRFKLYTSLSGGSPIWTETWCDTATCDGLGGGTDDRIRVTNGLFSTMLGSTTNFAGIDFNQPLYLSVEIG